MDRPAFLGRRLPGLSITGLEMVFLPVYARWCDARPLELLPRIGSWRPSRGYAWSRPHPLHVQRRGLWRGLLQHGSRSAQGRRREFRGLLRANRHPLGGLDLELVAEEVPHSDADCYCPPYGHRIVERVDLDLPGRHQPQRALGGCHCGVALRPFHREEHQSGALRALHYPLVLGADDRRRGLLLGVALRTAQWTAQPCASPRR
mmetsp:Transcript_58884/g.170313  ORF Transcript_58884/g.170313 Transcript_58884/m.170313 type:complete len:204 (-) Transcript_58884:237-848(-)